MKCEAELHIADDQGDNEATMVCGLDKGHDAKTPHEERYPRGDRMTQVLVQWFGDDRTAPNGN